MNKKQQYLPAKVIHVTPAEPNRRSGPRRVYAQPANDSTRFWMLGQAARATLGIGARLALTGAAMAMMTLMFIVVAGLFVIGANAAGEEVPASSIRIRQVPPLPTPTLTPSPPQPLPLPLAGVGQYTLENGVEVTEIKLPPAAPTLAPAIPAPVEVTRSIEETRAAWLPASPLVGWPAGGQATQGFGCSPYFTGLPGPECPATAPWFHDGIDIANIEGAPVRAALAGTVIFAGADGDGPVCGKFQGYGLSVIIDNGQGWQTLYGHLSRIDVVKGQAVEPDTLIGAVGQSGCTSGPHLHFSLKYQGNLVDPVLFTPE